MSTILNDFNNSSSNYRKVRDFSSSNKKNKGVQSLTPCFPTTGVTPSSDLLKQTSKFKKGLLETPNVQLPVELVQKKSKLTFKYQDKESGLVILMKLELNPLLTHGDISFETSESTIAAKVLSTRFLYLFLTDESHFLVISNDIKIELKLAPLSDTQKQKILHQAKLFRKLRFIEKCLENKLGRKLQIPTVASSNDVWLIDNIFRGITRGNVYSKTARISTYKSPPFDLDLSGLLDKRPVPTTFDVDGVSLFDQKLPLGQIRVVLPQAILLNPESILEKTKSGYTKELQLTFKLTDERAIFHFSDFIHYIPKQNRLLNEFKQELLSQEPPILANLLTEPISENIPSDEAAEIVMGWIYSHLTKVPWPSNTSIKKIEFNSETQRWNVMIALAYDLPTIQRQGGFSAIFTVDSKTGSILKHPTVEEMESKIRFLLETKPDSPELLNISQHSYESVNSELTRYLKITSAVRKAVANQAEAAKYRDPSSALEEPPPEEISSHPINNPIDFSKIRRIRRKA